MDSDYFIGRLSGLFDEVTLQVPPTGAIVALLVAILLLWVSGFLSASEIAFFSLTQADKNEINQSQAASDQRIRTLLDDSERLLATILIANNLANVTIIVLCSYFFGQVIDFGRAGWAELTAFVLGLTALLLVLGEVVPKMYSARRALAFCRQASGTMLFLRRLLQPFASLLMRSTTLANRVVARQQYNISVDELSQALELTDNGDKAEERNMLKGIIRFGDETAKEVMTPRMDIVDLDMTASYAEVLQCVVENAYSRIPVYAGSHDNIKGILYIKDLLPHLNKGNNFRWQSLIRAAYFVPETKMIDDLLRDFQANKIHIAIVVDEFGGTSGLITMEDIIEEIVGEINDEYDEEQRSYVKINENTYIFEAKTLLSDLYKVLKVEESEFEPIVGEADTLAGLLLELKGEFPKRHEVLTYKQYQFEVLEMDARRILKVKLTIRDSEPAAEAE